MIISEKKSFIFVHNPKAAGTSVRKILTDLHHPEVSLWGFNLFPAVGRVLDVAHIPLDVLLQVHPEIIGLMSNYFSFGFVRHPIQRFFSSVHQFLNVTTKMNKEAIIRDKTLFDRYVSEWACANLDAEAIDTDCRLVHFVPQKRFFYLYNVQCVKAFKVEEMQALPAELQSLGLGNAVHENPSASNLKINGQFDQSGLTKEAREKILAFYADDFAAFGYSA